MYTISHYSPDQGRFHGEVIATTSSLAKATNIATAYRIAYGSWTQISLAGIDLVAFYADAEGASHEDWHVSYNAWRAMSALATPDGGAYVVAFEAWREDDVTGAVTTKQGDLRMHDGEFLFVDSATSEHLTLNTMLAYGWTC